MDSSLELWQTHPGILEMQEEDQRTCTGTLGVADQVVLEGECLEGLAL